MSEALPDSTRMATVSLDVADLDAMTRFYRDVLLLDVIEASGDAVALGRLGRALVRLRHRLDLPKGERRSAGLFHTALLYPTHTELATALASFAKTRPDLYTGSADHLVSKAFYLDDPEGNGVELYWDRPRDKWQWQGGRVQMDTIWIDPNQFIAEHLSQAGLDLIETAPDRRVVPHTETVGHVHLRVGQVDQAKDFYVDTLGFDVTAEAPGALFVSAGGYHHHMAMNTWQSPGAGLRAPALGLGRVDIALPDLDAVTAVTQRLRTTGHSVRGMNRGVEVDDPWGNLVRLTA